MFFVFIGVQPRSGTVDSPTDYQKEADAARGGWTEEMANPLGCVRQAGDKFTVHLLSPPATRSELRIEFRNGDRVAFTRVGHVHSVYRIIDDRLYFADFDFSGTGGDIVAVDLEAGKELWRSSLKALGPIKHSAYSNVSTSMPIARL